VWAYGAVSGPTKNPHFNCTNVSQPTGVMQNYYSASVFDGTASTVQLTFVGTIAFIFINGMGPPMQILKSIIGARLLIGSGCLLMCLGLILAGFSTQVFNGAIATKWRDLIFHNWAITNKNLVS
jgi:hypothetical protein